MITIAIPALNEERQIGNLLDSIRAQDFSEEIEVVVADAGSIDRTREIIATYARHIPRLRIIEGGRPAAGRNRAARASLGDPIFFVDADVQFISSSFLRSAVDHFRKHGLTVAATPLIARSENLMDRYFGHASHLAFHVSKYIRPSGAMCVVASRSAFERVGGYPEDVFMSEDHDFVGACCRVGQYGVVPLPVSYSIRRVRKEGRVKLAVKYVAVSAYGIFLGPMRKPIFKYDFSYTHEEDVA
jgi:glycosyltransferase involved in cell wall biosynthesis